MWLPVMQLDTHTMFQRPPVCVDIDRAELEQRLAKALLRHKFVIMIDDHEAGDIARDLAEEVMR